MRSVRRGVWAVSAALVLAPSFVWSGDGEAHGTAGTVARIEKNRLDVKDADGKTVSFVLSQKTVVRRGAVVVKAEGLKVGERVAVKFEESGSGKTATEVRLVGSEENTRYSCPMHPEVVSDKPGKCPKCGMNLTPATQKNP